MSYGQRKFRTIILVAMVPIAIVSGVLIAWSMYSNQNFQELDIEGSTTVYKIIEEAQHPFIDVHPFVALTITGTSSSSGIIALSSGLVEIAMSSKPVTISENETTDGNLRSFPIAKDVLAMIINDAASPLNITLDIGRAIFNGTITDWSHPAVNATGLTGIIQVVVRQDGSGSRDFFNEYVMGDIDQIAPGSEYVSGAVTKTSNQLVLDDIKINENYIGYVGLGYIEEGVEAIKINNIEPTKETAIDESYPIQRNLFLITYGDPNPESVISEFIRWIQSPPGQTIVDFTGFVAIYPITLVAYKNENKIGHYNL
ncbi:MAG: substrate-binding domain-containing protein [Candidatus Heimdallarchaeota archaeon]